MNPGDQQFFSFEDFTNQGSGVINQQQVHADLGTPNQQLFGEPNQANQGFPDKSNQERSFWTIEYYQKFFNVSTDDVIERLKRSMIPHGTDNYLISYIRPKPDLYGPFWVCVTLIFAIAISGNIANYIQSANSGNYHWKYEFHIVSYAATCIFLYAWLLPLILWGAIKWSKSVVQNTNNELIETNTDIGLLELVCLYGYSLTIYIPVAFLWTIQISPLQWSLVIIATLLSGGVLLKSLMPMLPEHQKIFYISIIMGMHLILAAGFMLYFFHVPSSSHVNIISTTTTTTTVANNILKDVGPNNSAVNKPT